jgi:hypothetical protein
VEQRIGSSSQPLEGAGFDPAYIPGLTSPASDGPADAEPEEPEAPAEPEESAPGETVSGTAGSEEADSGADSEGEPDGPVFEASDRRARIVADHRGVRLALDDQECEFRWDEIGAVETESPRFGKRYTVTVHTPDRRWYPIEIEATSRSLFKDWDEQLDAVLDAYFDDGADSGDGDGDGDRDGHDDGAGTDTD